MSVESTFKTHLATDGTLAAIHGGRVYGAGKLPQNATRPALTYQRISTDREQTITGSIEASNVRFQLNMICDLGNDIDAFQAALVAAVQSYATGSGTTVFDKSVEDESEEYDPDTMPGLLVRRLEVVIGHAGAS